MSRTLTIIAVAVLAFDGAALAAAGFMTGRMVLVPVGVAFLLASGLVLLYWRWQRRRLQDIVEAKRALAEEAVTLSRSAAKARGPKLN